MLFQAPGILSLDSWSPDGRFIVFTRRGEREGTPELAVLPFDGEHKPWPIQTSFPSRRGRISPNSRWLAYVSAESGKDEIFVQTFPEPAGKWQVSTNGGIEPHWRRDGREIFYVSPEGMLMAVAVGATGAGFETGSPRPLFRTATDEAYAVSPDGERFLMAFPTSARTPDALHVVVGWDREFRSDSN